MVVEAGDHGLAHRDCAVVIFVEVREELAGAEASRKRSPRTAFADAVSANVADTFRRLPAGDFEAVAELLADQRRPLHLLGGRFTDGLARYMTAHLRIVRPQVAALDGQRANLERGEAYQALADDHFETERYAEFCDSTLAHVDDMVLEWIDGPDFRSLLQSTIQQTYPPHEWERFEGHFGGLLGMWVSDERRIRGADA